MGTLEPMGGRPGVAVGPPGPGEGKPPSAGLGAPGAGIGCGPPSGGSGEESTRPVGAGMNVCAGGGGGATACLAPPKSEKRLEPSQAASTKANAPIVAKRNGRELKKGFIISVSRIRMFNPDFMGRRSTIKEKSRTHAPFRRNQGNDRASISPIGSYHMRHEQQPIT